MAEQQKLREIGVLWARISRDKKTRFLSGVINNGVFGVVDIVCFQIANDHKTENGPDYRIMVRNAARTRQESDASDNEEEKNDLNF